MGTQMILKRASFAALFRFANVTGIVMPETFAGVGDLPVGAYMTLGYDLPGDSMAAVYKSKCVLVWACNPAATRIPDAHFFWEARYNGTEVVTISPDFNATAMHSLQVAEPEARHRHGAGDGDGADHHRRRSRSTGTTCASRPTCRSWCATTTASSCGPATSARPGDRGRQPPFYFWDETTDASRSKAPGHRLSGRGARPPGGGAAQPPSRWAACSPALEGRWKVKTQPGRGRGHHRLRAR